MAKVSAELEELEKIQAERRRLVEAGPRVARSAGDFERVAHSTGVRHVIIDAYRDHFHGDLYFLREIVCPGGLVLLDDCNYQSVAAAVRYLEVKAGWQRQPIDGETRLRAFRLPIPQRKPNFEDFKPFGDGD